MAAVQIVPTHVVRASDGQATASNELHYSPQLGFPVSKKLVGKRKQDLLAHMKVCYNYYLYSELGFEILRFIIRNIYLAFVPVPGTELLNPLEFPKR